MLRFSKVHCLLSLGLLAGPNIVGFACQIPSQVGDLKLDGQTSKVIGRPVNNGLIESYTPPSITVRPHSDPKTPAVDCQIEIEPIPGKDENQFRLKLVIPQSVRQIEILPQGHLDDSRSMRVTIDQGSDLLAPLANSVEPLPPLLDSQPSPGDPLLLKNNSPFVKNPFFRNASSKAFASPIANDPHATPLLPSTALVALETTDYAAGLRNDKSKSVLANPSQNSVQLKMAGPRRLESGELVNFEILLHNDSPVVCRGLIVQLKIPAGLEIFQLDRVAWLDQPKQVITWEIPLLQPQQRESISYLARSSQPGEMIQNVTAAKADKVMARTNLQTHIESATDNGAFHHFSDSNTVQASFVQPISQDLNIETSSRRKQSEGK